MQDTTYIYELAEFYSEVGNFVTNHTHQHLDEEQLSYKYHDYVDLSYQACSLIKRLQDFHHHAEIPFIHVYDDMTLRNVILTDRDNIRRELRHRGCRDVDRYNDEQLIYVYFGQYPSRDQLVEYVQEMVTVEYDLASPGDELPIGYLMIGIFYLPGYQHKEDVNWIPNKGNLHLLSPSDLAAIGYLLGTPLHADHNMIESFIQREQNLICNELLSQGYTERLETYSMTEMIIQRETTSCLLLPTLHVAINHTL